MTEVNIKSCPGRIRIRAEGHAGWGCKNGLPEGHDIVCAAISILLQTAAQRLMDLEAERKVLLLKMQLNPGNVDITASIAPEASEAVNELLKTIETGFKLLEAAYGAHIHLG